MKNFLIVIILFCAVLSSCDGRKSPSEALKSSIAEFNKKQLILEVITYYPKEYTEVVTDTIIANDVKIHIKNYSLNDDGILMASSNTSNKIKKQHRVFTSEIVISTPTKELFSTEISAEQFKSLYSDVFWNNATLQHVWVNQELSTSDDIKLDMSFINPKDNSYKLYRMSIDGNGKQHIDFIEERT